VLLGSRNRLINRGAGPLSLHGERTGARTMRVAQRVYGTGRGHRSFDIDGARFDFWRIPGEGRYWKLRDALSIELWTSGERPRRVRSSPKTRFCMRDLFRAPGRTGPRGRIFGACSQNDGAGRVRMGLSRGWTESYPAFYHEQSIDVTGLRGCFDLRHRADPENLILESDESNNAASTFVRLPLRRGSAGRC
jgi:hypothetical protein